MYGALLWFVWDDGLLNISPPLFLLIPKIKQLVNCCFQRFGYVMSKIKRRVVFILLQIDDCFPPYANFPCQIFLGQIIFCPEFFYSVFHGG